MFSYTLGFLGSALYSMLVETLVVVLLLRLVWKQPHVSWRDMILAGATATLATIPYVWYVFPIFFYHSSLIALLFGEIFAVIIETIIYRFWLRQPLNRAFILALVANATSYYTGKLIQPWQLFTGV